jgi:hypothetical protein
VNHLKTYISVFISSEGEKASDITDLLRNLGFDTTFGSYDFVFDWKKKVEYKDVESFIDTVQNKLKGMDVRFNITTVK